MWKIWEIYKKALLKYIIPIHFDDTGLEFIHLSSILHENDIIIYLPESLREDKILSIVYSLSNITRNKIFNYKNTVNNISNNDTRTYGTAIIWCSYINLKYLDHHHGHIINWDLQILENEKLYKIISKGSNYREPKTINWKKAEKASRKS